MRNQVNNTMKNLYRKLCVMAFGVMMFGAAPAAEVITYLHNDVVGSPLVATDQSGNVVWKESYHPYGEQLQKQPGSTNNHLWFAGKSFEQSSGLSYSGARYYDPMLGRFMGVDPVDFNEKNIHSFNRYAYGNDNPYRFVDPDGRETRENGADAAKYTGQQLGDAGAARARYQDGVAGLNSGDSAGRSALKTAIRNETPKTVSEMIKVLRPSTDAVAGTGGNASHSNDIVNKLGAGFRMVGPALVGVGYAIDAYDVATSANTYRTLMKVSVGTLGAIGGGTAGAFGGTFICPGPCTIAGGVGGAIAGGQAGRDLGERAFDAINR